MAALRGTLFMQVGNAGWSESWFQNNADLGGAMVKLGRLADERRALLPTGGLITGMRATQLQAPGLSVVRNLQYAADSGLERDVPFISLLFRAISGLTGRREFILRGVPDARVVGGVYVPATAYNRALQAYWSMLIRDEWAIQQIDRNNPLSRFASVDNTGVIHLIDNADYDIGTPLKFFRSKTVSGLSLGGIWTVSARATLLVPQVANWPATETVKTGKVRKVTYVYGLVTEWEGPYRVISKKVGRPFGAPIGRRKARSKRQLLAPAG